MRQCGDVAMRRCGGLSFYIPRETASNRTCQLPFLEIVAIIISIKVPVNIHTSKAADTSLNWGRIYRGSNFRIDRNSHICLNCLLFAGRYSSLEILLFWCSTVQMTWIEMTLMLKVMRVAYNDAPHSIRVSLNTWIYHLGHCSHHHIYIVVFKKASRIWLHCSTTIHFHWQIDTR